MISKLQASDLIKQMRHGGEILNHSKTDKFEGDLLAISLSNG